METKIGVSYTSLTDLKSKESENQSNGGALSAAASPSAKPKTPTRGYLAQRVHAFSKQKNHRPKAAASASTTEAKPRNKVLEAVQAFEAINKTATERTTAPSPIITPISPAKTSSKTKITIETRSSSTVLKHVAEPALDKEKEGVSMQEPGTTLLMDSNVILDDVSHPNECCDDAVESAGNEDHSLFDQSCLLEELVAVVETCAANDKALATPDESPTLT
jgi:hypothetical protein